jgi:hypothetical protein
MGSAQDGGVTSVDVSSATVDGGSVAGTTAPLDWTLHGTPSLLDGVVWNTPKGWTAAVATDGVVLTAPATTGSCAIVILAPRAAAADQAGRLQQLLSIVTTQFSGHTLADEYGNWPPKTGITRGTSGTGFEFVGYSLNVDGSKMKTQPYLAIFGSTAIPVVPLANTTNGACLLANDGAANALEVYDSLTMSGFTKTLPVSPSIVGDWYTGTTDIGFALNLQSTGTFEQTSIYDPSLGTKVTLYSNGTYTANANVISYFPVQANSAPVSHYFRTYEQSNSSVGSGWISYYCELALSTNTPPAPYELCYSRQ